MLSIRIKVYHDLITVPEKMKAGPLILLLFLSENDRIVKITFRRRLNMSAGWIVVIVLTVVLVAALIALYFLGKRAEKKPGRNDPCPCGSGKKYKNCCGKNE